MLLPVAGPGTSGPDPAHPGTSGRRYDPVDAKIVVATLFAAAAVIGTGVQVLPLWEGTDRWIIAVLSAVAVVCALVLPRMASLPYPVAAGLTASGTMMIALAQYAAGPGAGGATFASLYCLSLAAAFLFYSTRVLVGQVVLAVLAQLTALVALDQARTAAVTILVTTGAACGTGIVTRTLADLRARAEAELLWRASHDGLTGLANRVALTRAWGPLAATEVVSVLVVDLRGFKQVNDGMGHQCGDAVLVQVGERLGRLPPPALPCRLGGDEFAVLLPGTGAAQARELAEQLSGLLHETYRVGDVSLPLAVTVGVATRTPAAGGRAADPKGAPDAQAAREDHLKALSTLLAAADAAMYHAREVGRTIAAAHEIPAGSVRAAAPVGLAREPRSRSAPGAQGRQGGQERSRRTAGS